MTLSVNTREIIDLLSHLADEDKLRVTVKESLKGGLVAGTSATVGGIALGPLGMLFGGIIGSITAALLANDFVSVAEIIVKMEAEKKEALAMKVKNIMSSIDVTDVAVFTAMIAGDTALRSKVVCELAEYLRTEMSLAIVDH